MLFLQTADAFTSITSYRLIVWFRFYCVKLGKYFCYILTLRCALRPIRPWDSWAKYPIRPWDSWVIVYVTKNVRFQSPAIHTVCCILVWKHPALKPSARSSSSILGACSSTLAVKHQLLQEWFIGLFNLLPAALHQIHRIKHLTN